MLKNLKDGTSPIAFAAADAARGDASTVSVDTLLADAISKLDGLSTRMDALETKTHNPIKGDAAKKADDDDDDKKKDDGITQVKNRVKDDDDDDDKKKDDSKTKADDDDDDDDKKKRRDDDGTLKMKHKRDDDGELEVKHKGKAELKDDAFPPKKAKDDDDDDDRRDDTHRSDSMSPELLHRLSRLEAIVKPMTDEEHAVFAETQARADSVFNGFGKRAPRPMEGEGIVDYRTRLANTLKPYSKVWSKAKLTKLPIETFEIAEEQIYTDAIEAAAHPSDLDEGELRAVTTIDQNTGLRTTKFFGKESFIKGISQPNRRITKIRTERSV
jgi:hypothetical protein